MAAFGTAGLARAQFCPATSDTIGTGGGTRPNTSACADLDNDGFADIVTANDSTDDLTILFGNSTGFDAPVRIAVGTQPVTVIAVDVNADTHLDIVSCEKGSNSLTILFGDGGGAFPTSDTLPIGAAPYQVLAEDFDGDEIVDLAVSNTGGDSVGVLLGLGGGSFAAQVEYTTTDSPNGLVSCDLNGDTIPDLVSGDLGSGNASVFYGAGDGTFQAALTVPLGGDPFDVACCDLDGANGPDIVAVDGLASAVLIAPNDGAGGFDPVIARDGGTGAFAAACVDVTSDGWADVLTANLVDDDLVVLANTGDPNTLAVTQSIPIGSNPSDVEPCDVDGDGVLDLVVAFRSGVKVVTNTCDPPEGPQPDPTGPPGALACSGGDANGLLCSTCVGGSRAGLLCYGDEDCAGSVCAADDAMCGGGGACSVPAPYEKSRFITFGLRVDPGEPIAVRVTLESVSGNASINGQVRWAGAAESLPEGDALTPDQGSWWGAGLGCAPVFFDLPAPLGRPVHLFGEEIVPGSLYRIETVAKSCDPGGEDPACRSDPLFVRTGEWGDAVLPFASTTTTSQPDVNDVLGAVDKFLGAASAPTKPRVLFLPASPQVAEKIDLSQILAIVDAFLGVNYPLPHADPTACD